MTYNKQPFVTNTYLIARIFARCFTPIVTGRNNCARNLTKEDQS
jgi:hypothetical protein